jgi:hypothetical protein
MLFQYIMALLGLGRGSTLISHHKKLREERGAVWGILILMSLIASTKLIWPGKGLALWVWLSIAGLLFLAMLIVAKQYKAFKLHCTKSNLEIAEGPIRRWLAMRRLCGGVLLDGEVRALLWIFPAKSLHAGVEINVQNSCSKWEYNRTLNDSFYRRSERLISLAETWAMGRFLGALLFAGGLYVQVASIATSGIVLVAALYGYRKLVIIACEKAVGWERKDLDPAEEDEAPWISLETIRQYESNNMKN